MKTLSFWCAVAVSAMAAACAVEPEDDDVEDADELAGDAASEEVGSSQDAMAGDTCWSCYQICANGSVSLGWGWSPDAAYRDMGGCGPGGGAVQCDAEAAWICPGWVWPVDV